MLVWLNKMVLAQHFGTFAKAGTQHSKASHLMIEKSKINISCLLLPVFDWPLIMIAPVVLQLVVSNIFAVPILVLWVGLEKKHLAKPKWHFEYPQGKYLL
jgi:hypothetical protein